MYSHINTYISVLVSIYIHTYMYIYIYICKRVYIYKQTWSPSLGPAGMYMSTWPCLPSCLLASARSSSYDETRAFDLACEYEAGLYLRLTDSFSRVIDRSEAGS